MANLKHQKDAAPVIHVDNFDDIPSLSFIDVLADTQTAVISPEFQDELLQWALASENNAPTSLDDPFGLTQWIPGAVRASSLEEEGAAIVVQDTRLPAPEALLRANVLVSQLATWVFQKESEVSPELIKQVLQGLLQDQPLPKELLQTNPDVGKYSEKQKIKATLEFIKTINPNRIFLPYEIAESISPDAFRIYRRLMQECHEGKMPAVLGNDRTVMVQQFMNELVGYAMVDAMRFSVKSDGGFVIPNFSNAGKDVHLDQNWAAAIQQLTRGSLRSDFIKEGKKGLSAESVRLILDSLHKNLNSFNSYIEFLDQQKILQAAPEGIDAEQAKVLLCSYVWALWHVSGTSVLEAEGQLERHHIELTAERQEDLMILKLLKLSFEDLKKPWSELAQYMKQHQSWTQTYADPELYRKKLSAQFKNLAQAKKIVDTNVSLKSQVDQQQALLTELNRLKKIERQWQIFEKQGGIEGRIKAMHQTTSPLTSKDVTVFDFLA